MLFPGAFGRRWKARQQNLFGFSDGVGRVELLSKGARDIFRIGSDTSADGGFQSNMEAH